MKANNKLNPKAGAGPVGETLLDRDRFAGALQLCIHKTRDNIKPLADNPEPSSWSWDREGRYWEWNESFFALGNWTTSFITGMALLAWRETEDEYFLQQTLRLAPKYREKAFTEAFHSHHDMGFLYSLYSVALYKLTGDRQHREVGLRAAEALYQRFNPAGNFFRAWGRLQTPEHENMAIIDCMMNLPLLHWASLESGDAKFRDAAIRQADTTLKCFIRPDDSVFHAYRFDLKSGQPIGGDNYCGYSVDSHWARGTGWAMYGFALSYRYTHDPKYLEAAVRMAKAFIANLDVEVVPVWDFKLPAAEPRLRDSSAAAVAVCGFQELAKYGAADSQILQVKRTLLDRLCDKDYLDASNGPGGVLKLGQVGRAENAYTSWGDYFFMEALAREAGAESDFW